MNVTNLVTMRMKLMKEMIKINKKYVVLLI